MGQNVELTAADGHRLSAYKADPAGKPRGGIVVIQEIFGVTRHIRAVADQYAAAGFVALAPAMFDRVERNVEVPYTDSAKGRSYVQALDNEQVALDVRAALERVSSAGKVGVLGYCWGGLIAYLSATRTQVDAAIVYYGGGIERHTAHKPRAPILFHFGEQDTHIPLSVVDAIKTAVPEGIYYLYPAAHGFNCPERPSFDPPSAELAFERSLDFFYRHLG